jgi:hypothetical protein
MRRLDRGEWDEADFRQRWIRLYPAH